MAAKIPGASFSGALRPPLPALCGKTGAWRCQKNGLLPQVAWRVFLRGYSEAIVAPEVGDGAPRASSRCSPQMWAVWIAPEVDARRPAEARGGLVELEARRDRRLMALAEHAAAQAQL